MRAVRVLTIVVLGALGATAAAAPAASRRTRIVVSRPLPNPVRSGQTAIVTGSLRHAPAKTGAVLQIRRPGQTRWGAVARARPRHGGRFTLRWLIPRATGPISWRLAAIRNGAALAATPARQALIGPGPVYCQPPPPVMQNLPAGDGWIVGGAYIEGGPAPGIFECSSQRYTVTATGRSGAAGASENVAGGHSYTLVVPAGRYSLKSSPCGFGSATVTAGKETRADVVCPVP